MVQIPLQQKTDALNKIQNIHQSIGQESWQGKLHSYGEKESVI